MEHYIIYNILLTILLGVTFISIINVIAWLYEIKKIKEQIKIIKSIQQDLNKLEKGNGE